MRIIDFPYHPNAEPLFERIRTMPNAVWLDSGKPESLYGRFDIISAAPDAILETRQGQTIRISSSRLSGKTGTTTNPQTNQNPFHATQALLDDMEPVQDSLSHFPFTGGLIGYWGYDLSWNGSPFSASKQLALASNPTDIPDMRLGRYLWSLVLNHSTRKGYLFFHSQCPTALQDEILERLNSKQPPQNLNPEYAFSLTSAFTANTNKKQYLEAIDAIQRYITEGDCYQVNFAQHFSAGFKGDSWQAYKKLRHVLPSPYSAYIAWDDNAILSLSPERFIKLSMGQVETKPIKGTIPRGKTLAQDQQRAIQLQNSQKDRAENLMIVDLLRNDLGKTCRPGSIKVPKLFALESYRNVHHLVSTITGTLTENNNALNLLAGCFPGGSITGTPKKRAMEIIRELETEPRGVYCGSIGYISLTGRMDSNIAIRTLVAEGDKLHCWGGGGIVADSDPESEYQESITKVKILMDSLQA